MPQNELAEAVEKIRTGISQDVALTEFVDTFDIASTDVERYAILERAPELTNDPKLDALVGAIAEYLAKQNKLGRVPPWASNPRRTLERAWHTSSIFIDWKREFLTDGMREYLTFASPAEFASHNIFTEECPLRCARSIMRDS